MTELFAIFQLDLVVLVPNGAFVAVSLGTQLLPVGVIAEINALVLRSVDVTGPEQADVAVDEGVLGRLEAEAHVEVMGSNQGEAGPAFNMESRSRRLVQLGFCVGDSLESH